MVLPEPAMMDAWASGFLELAPDEHRAKVCASMIGALAGHLHLMIGGREASAALYAIADRVAVSHIPGDPHG